jgi:pimeloyl-ACP methyl ester carboxylesterase
MWTSPLNYTAGDFARVLAPTLVLLGDRDELVSVEEAMEMARLLLRSELAVVPGADHGAFFSTKVATFLSPMLDFLLRHSAPLEPAVSS